VLRSMVVVKYICVTGQRIGRALQARVRGTTLDIHNSKELLVGSQGNHER